MGCFKFDYGDVNRKFSCNVNIKFPLKEIFLSDALS